MFVKDNPLRLAQKLAEAILAVPTTTTAVEEARERLRLRRDARGEPQDRKGPEYVIENLVRPRLEDFLSLTYKVPSDHIRFWVGSSHYHSGNDTHSAEWWTLFRTRNPTADTHDKTGALRRADLFVVTLAGQIVSIELKYLRAQKSFDKAGYVAQVEQYLAPGDGGVGHDATILVVYAERPDGLPSRLADLGNQLAVSLPRRVIAVVLEGPPVGV